MESCLSEKGEEVLDHVLHHYFFFPSKHTQFHVVSYLPRLPQGQEKTQT